MTEAGASLRAARGLTVAAVMMAASITLMEAALSLALLAWLGCLVLSRHRRRALPDGELVALLFLLTAWSGFSALRSVDPPRALAAVSGGLLWLAAPLAAATLGRGCRRLVRAVLLLQGALLGVWAVAEYLLWWDGDPLLRVRGPFSHHMTLSGFLMLAILQGLPRPTLWPLLPRRAGRLLGGVALLPAGAGLAATLTRSAALGLAGGLLLLALTASRSRHRNILAVTGLAALAAALAAVAVPWALPAEGQAVPAGLASMEDRVQLWRAGRDMVRDHPWFGVGADLTSVTVAAYLDPAYRRPDMPSHLHSAWLTLAAERGLPALALLLTLYGESVRRGLRWRGRGAGADPARGALAALAGFCVMGLFEDNFGDTEVLFVLLIILAELWRRPPRRAVPPRPS